MNNILKSLADNLAASRSRIIQLTYLISAQIESTASLNQPVNYMDISLRHFAFNCKSFILE